MHKVQTSLTKWQLCIRLIQVLLQDNPKISHTIRRKHFSVHTKKIALNMLHTGELQEVE